MPRLALVVSLVLSSCVALSQVGPVRFATPCGLQVHGYATDGGMPVQWNVDTVSEAESRLLAALELYADDVRVAPAPRACARLKGWHVYPHPDDWFVNPAGKLIAGTTNCDKHLVIAGRGDPRRWAFQHELIHVLQRCEPWGHEGWRDGGLYPALESLGVE